MEDFDLVTHLHNIGISDEKIARQCNVSRQFINNVRNGKKRAGAELHTKLQELYDAASQRGLLDTYKPPVQTRIVESIPVIAPVLYDPPTQQRAPIIAPTHTQPAQSQPAKRRWPLSIAELDARNEARKQVHTPSTIPVQRQPAKQLLPLNVRRQLVSEWKWACKCAKRRGLPKPPKPNMFETPITEASEHQAPDTNRIDYPTQQNNYQALIGYSSHSPYRQW